MSWLDHRALPLALIAVMVGIGLVVEPLVYGVSQWPSKLLLLALLAIYPWRRTSSRLSGR